MTTEEYLKSVEEEMLFLNKLIGVKADQYASDDNMMEVSNIGAKLSNMNDIKFMHTLMSKHIAFVTYVIDHPTKLKNKLTMKKFKDSMMDIHVFQFLISGLLKDAGLIDHYTADERIDI